MNLVSQIRTASREKDELKRRFEKLGKKLALIEEHLQHAKDIALARKQVKIGEIITQEKLLDQLGI